MFKKVLYRNLRLLLISVIILFASVLKNGYSQVTEVDIGNNDENSSLFPINRGTHNSVWEGLYLANEISNSGYINYIGFKINGLEAGSDILKNVKIFLKKTSDESLEEGSYNNSEYTKVFDGNLAINSDSSYAIFYLSVPFYYDNSNSDNLLIVVEHENQFPYEIPVIWTVSNYENLCRYDYADELLPDYLFITNSRPDIKLGLGCMFIYPLQNRSICFGDSVQIGNNIAAEGGGDLSYVWENYTGLNNPEISNPLASPETTMEYYLTVTGSECEAQISNTMTLYVSNGAQDIKMGDQNVISICDGRFYDSGGENEDYSYNEDHTLTIYPCDSLHKISVTFDNFELGENDWLKVFFGNSIEDNTVFSNGDNIGELISSHSSGALTFVFHSDDQSSGNGWSAGISCIARACEEIAGNATIRSPLGYPSLSIGDTLHSGEAILELTGYYGAFKGWLKSYNDLDYFYYTDSISPHTFNNSTTYYKALVTHNNDNDSCFSNVVKYYSSNNYYVNDASQDSDIWCSNIGSALNKGLSPDKPINDIYSIITQYNLRQSDTIFVDAGIYSNSSILLVGYDYGSNNDTNKRIVFLGAGNDKTKINTYTGIYGTYGFEFNGFSFNHSINCENISNLFIHNCSLIENTYSNINIWGDDSSKYIIFDNNYFQTSNYNYNIELYYHIDDCKISNNVLLYTDTNNLGSTGIYFENQIKTKNLIIENNYINTASIGIWLYGFDVFENLKISGNYINIRDNITEGSTCIYVENISADSTHTSTINNNHLRGGYHSIDLMNLNNTRLFNNFISNSQYGINISSSANNVGVYSNSFYNYKNNINISDIGSTNFNLKNNIFYNTSSTVSDVCINVNNSTIDDSLNILTSCDYNLFYIPNGAKLAKFGTNTINSIESLKLFNHVYGNVIGDEYSVYGNPEYYDAERGNLILFESSLANGSGTSIEDIDYDINYNTLTSSHFIGAMSKVSIPNSPNGPYAELKRKLDGGYHLVTSSPYLLIKYTEEYNPINSKLKFKIYDNNHTVVMSSNSTSNIISNSVIKYGDNYCSIKLFGCTSCVFHGLPSGNFYLLEVSNDKNEKWYLRFKYDYTFNVYLDPCICVHNQLPELFSIYVNSFNY